jgi:hypothetical protein
MTSLADRSSVNVVHGNDGATVDVWRPVAHVERGVKVQGGGALPDIGEVPVALDEQTAVQRVGSHGVRRGALER